MNGRDRIATEGTNSIWSFRGRSTSSRAVPSLYASFVRAEQSTDTLSRSYNISCRWKKRSSDRQSLVKEHFKDNASS